MKRFDLIKSQLKEIITNNKKIFFLKKKYRILYIQPIGAFSGSLKSSEEYLKNLYKKFDFIFLTQNGFAKDVLKNTGKYSKLLEFVNMIILKIVIIKE